MTQYRLEQVGDQLLWLGAHGQRIGQRALTGAGDLIADVGKTFWSSRSLRDLQTAGRLLFRWLDGEEGWLTKAIAQEGVLSLQFQLDPSLRDLPWEVCHDGHMFLAERADLAFHPWYSGTLQGARASASANGPLRLLFMACAAEEVRPVLNFEAEERAILVACKGREIELVVEESGSLEGLVQRLRLYGPGYFDVLHLSGHAEISGSQPIFIMENTFGERHDVTPYTLAQALCGDWPPLIFLTGCLTGKAPEQGHLPSFCECLVEAGAPFVLGWSQRVGDESASQVAAALYGHLAAGAPLGLAVPFARSRLIKMGSAYWHNLRCYGFYCPINPFVTCLADPVDRSELKQPIIDKLPFGTDASIYVCAPDAFVGRRRLLQRCLRWLVAKPDETELYHEGLIITGMGGLGKSSLVARLCSRVEGYIPIVWTGRFNEMCLLERLVRLLDLPWLQNILMQPNIKLYVRLKHMFERLTRPLIIILDDFELNGKSDGDHPCFDDEGRLCIVDAARLPLRELLESIGASNTQCRVIITCRYEIVPPSTVSALRCESLDHLRGADLAKKLLNLQGFNRLDLQESAAHAQSLADGNPRLLETFDGLLNLSTAAPVKIRSVLLGLWSASAAFREQVLLAELIAFVEPECRLLLAKLSLCELPIPQQAIINLADEDARTNGLKRASRLGLVEYIDNGVSTTLYVSNILRPLLMPLLDKELRCASQGELADQLFLCWWHRDSEISLDQAHQVWHLALAGGRTQLALEATARIANRFNVINRYSETRELCQQVPDRDTHPATLMQLGLAEQMLGDTTAARAHLEEAVRLTSDLQHGSSWHYGRALFYLARLENLHGQVGRALELWHQALSLTEADKDWQGKAMILLEIASAKASMGEIEQALELWQEAGSLMEQAGNYQGKAAALHKMAGVYSQKGDFDRAIALWQQSLVLHEETRHLQGKAANLHEMAGVIAQQGGIERALELWRQSLVLNEQIGDIRGVAATLPKIAGLHARRGDLDRALSLWLESLTLSEQLGDIHNKAIALHDMAGVMVLKNEVEGAFVLWEQALEINRQTGNIQGEVTTLHDMARTLAQRGETERALTQWQLCLELDERVGNIQGRAVTLHNMAGVIAQEGDLERALEMWQQSLDILEPMGHVRGRASTLAQMAWAAGKLGDHQREAALNLQAVALLASVHAWLDVLTVLGNLGFSFGQLALLQAVWVLLHTQAPLRIAIATVEFLYHARDLDPRLPPLLAATAYHMIPTFSQNTTELGLAQILARKLLWLHLPVTHHSSEGILLWLKQQGLSQPSEVFPRLVAVLEELIGERWFFDCSSLMKHLP